MENHGAPNLFLSLTSTVIEGDQHTENPAIPRARSGFPFRRDNTDIAGEAVCTPDCPAVKCN